MIRAPLTALLAGLLLIGASTGCDHERGDVAMGDRCADDEECAEGLCVGGVAGDEPRCTRSCATSDECPDGWSCSGVTQSQVVVCKKGSATPFGD